MTVETITSPASQLAPPHSGRWTVADYERLPDDGPRVEIIEGAINMAPAPVLHHQSSSNLIAYYLTRVVQLAGLGYVFSAPTDVELGFETIVQPDILVVLSGGAAALTARRVVGPPDLIVEIVSPSTAGYDRREKQDAYAAAGVREYWIADPASRTVELLLPEAGALRGVAVFSGETPVASTVVPRWDVPTDALFG